MSLIYNNTERQYYENLGRQLNIYCSPVLLVLGSLGNFICIIILFRKRANNTNPTVTYLGVLAICDLLVIYTGLLRNYLKQLLSIDLRHSMITCKLHIYLTYVFMKASTYILVAVTVYRLSIMYERNLAFRPSKRKFNPLIKRRKDMTTLKKVCACIFIVLCIMDLPFLINYDYTFDKKHNRYECTVNKETHGLFYKFRTSYYGYMHILLFIVLPCIILIASNMLIILKISSTARDSRHKMSPAYEKRKIERRRRLTLMLVVVCLWFIVLKTPASVYITLPDAEEEKAYFPLTFQLFMLIHYTNHAVNFILYSITNSDFRREFRSLSFRMKKLILERQQGSEKESSL